MTTLFDITLDLARQIRGVARHKVSAVSNDGNTLYCPGMSNMSGEYNDGTVWVMTGDSQGKFSKIHSAINNHVTLEDEIDIAPGDIIMICGWIDFKLTDLINAINSVLYRYPILAMDDSLTWDSQQKAYEIPKGIADIRRIQIENSADDGTYTISHCWTEDRDGFIRFHTAQGLYKDGGKIQIFYRKMHGDVYEAEDEIDPMVDLNYLRNMSVLYLWREVIIHQHKDNPIASDLFNEAKMYEGDYLKFNIPERNIMIRDFYTRW